MQLERLGHQRCKVLTTQELVEKNPNLITWDTDILIEFLPKELKNIIGMDEIYSALLNEWERLGILEEHYITGYAPISKYIQYYTMSLDEHKNIVCKAVLGEYFTDDDLS